MSEEQKIETEVNKGGRPPMPKLDDATKAEMDKVVKLIEVIPEEKSVGRPPIIDEVVLQKLEMAFKVGCSDEEACFYADIGVSTFYEYQAAHKEFAEQKKLWKKRPVLKARQVVVQAIENNDLSTAKWYLEKHSATDFGDKVDVKYSGEVSTGGYQEDSDLIQKIEDGLSENIRKRWEEREKNEPK